MKLFGAMGVLWLGSMLMPAWGQEAVSADGPPVATRYPTVTTTLPAGAAQKDAGPMVEAEGTFDPAMFGRPIPAAELKGLEELAGGSSGDAWRDKQLKHVLKYIVPGCEFHYGRDMGMGAALDMVMDGSRLPVELIDGRYLVVSGANGPYLAGRGFVWIDLKAGLGLGGFFFRPTNGEPTPTMAVFSRMVSEDQIALSELPPAFVIELAQWSQRVGLPVVTTQYFLTGNNRRELLEHDADYCSAGMTALTPMGSDCEELNADAADVDEVAAYYLDQVNYKTNATAWMIGDDQREWVAVRERTCGSVADPLACRIRVSREHTHVILKRPAVRRR